ncbi:MAG: NRDE family protein [Acidobacteria bacterium]|nr:NRDE family protein [Acidobacteriota bacterium]
MCTLTIVTRDNGYSLAMNRDEQLTRNDAVPPVKVDLQGTSVVYPRNSAGGTWVAVNERGIALALLNWNDVPQPTTEKARSRGAVIPALVGCSSLAEVRNALSGLDLSDVWPFRLVGVFPSGQMICEWNWNQEKLETPAREWRSQHWFSSSLSDARASEKRGEVCQAAWTSTDAGTLPWMRRLHASHANGPGPFSLCVHRESVGTLSYTEIDCGLESIACRYWAGQPCEQVEPGDAVGLVRK